MAGTIWGGTAWGAGAWGDSRIPVADIGEGNPAPLSHPGYCHSLTDGGDLELDAAGKLVRDYGVASRCRMRLLCRRGQWPYDATMGSRFHTLASLREGQRRALVYAVEALQPLIDEGAVTGVEVGQIEVDDVTGRMALEVFISVPSGDGERVSVGTYRIGG